MSVSYHVYEYTLEAGSSVNLERQSTFVTCLSASARFKISFDDGPQSDFEAGLTYKPEKHITKLRITNKSSARLSLKVALGGGNITDARVVISSDVTLETREKSPNSFDVGVDFDILGKKKKKIASADELRRELIIFNKNDSPAHILVGSYANAYASPPRGMQIDAGGYFTLHTSDEVWAYNTATTTAKVSVATIGWKV